LPLFIRRVDTMVDVNCPPPCCNHWKVSMAQLDAQPVMCGKCGHRNPIIARRDSLRRWAAAADAVKGLRI
jgi:hypothetical protein